MTTGNGPRVTMASIEASIASEHYFTALDGDDSEQAVSVGDVTGDSCRYLKLLTFCVLVLRNGFTVTGESACVSEENFDADLGRKFARENAVGKLWPLLGFMLKEQVARSQHPFAGDCNDYGTALAAAKLGRRITRRGWNGKGLWVELQRPDANSKMTLPYLFLCYPEDAPVVTPGARVPWLASQTDMLAEDWVVLEEVATWTP